MRLLNWAKVHKQSKPDHDAIRAMEKECKLDDESFNERYDTALIEDFYRKCMNGVYTTEEQIGMLTRVYDDTTSRKYKEIVFTHLQQLEYLEFNQTRSMRSGYREEYDRLRARMMCNQPE